MRAVRAAGLCPAAARRAAFCFLAAGLLFPGPLVSAPAVPTVIDDFENPSGWSPNPADGVELRIGSGPGAPGKSLQLDFKFSGGGYAVAHKAFSLDLPENYAFSFKVKGECLPNTLEFKLIDATGENVWWSVKRDITFPRQWQTFTYKKRNISFAWGPAGGGEIRHVAAIEFAVTAGQGGTGTVWIDDLEIRELPPPGAAPPRPVVRASSERKGHAALLVADGDSGTTWMNAVRDPLPSITLDLVESREYGGAVVLWAPGKHPVSYDVEISDDGKNWRLVRPVRQTNGGRDYIYLPETESRYFRLNRIRGFTAELELKEIHLMPLDWSATREAFFEAIARDSPRGLYPRGFSGEQSYWTVVGLDGDSRECLFGEDGAIEVGKGEFSIEPFLYLDDRLVTWADVEAEHSLDQGFLPIPTVTWKRGPIELAMTAFAVGKPESSTVVVRYRVANRASPDLRPGERDRAKDVDLHLAIRPFQVNPPTQFLNTRGGVAAIRRIDTNAYSALVNDDRLLVPLPPPASIRVSHFDGGDVVADYLRDGHLPVAKEVQDSSGAASAVFSYRFGLKPGQEEEAAVVIPLHGSASPMPPENRRAEDWPRGAQVRAYNDWMARLTGPDLEIPTARGQDLLNAARSQIAWILVNRSGPAIQPGTRSYARSWIRDGALTSSALLRMREAGPVREFLKWFAPHQYANGKIPCVVDYRGADPVPEHDSSGEFIFLVAEAWRYTHDRDLLEEMWPRVEKAAAYLDSLRHERRTPEYEARDKREFFGILPPSISHEGYSAKPMHSYWDDFFALRGFKDAAFLAGEMGDRDAARRLAAIRDEFAGDFKASIETAMAKHKIDYIPGCADLGDFDATSTTIALSPVNAGATAPPRALRRTFDRYYEFFEGRLADTTWDALTPYENRNIGAFVRLGEADRAHAVADFLLSCRRPAGWNVWGEVVDRQERKPRFIGDMPHTWVGSDFVRSFLDMLAYDDDSDSTLVIGAGIPLEWIEADRGVVVRGLPTPYGPLSYWLHKEKGEIELRMDEGVRVPPGGIVVAVPAALEASRLTLNGEPVKIEKGRPLVLRALPAAVRYRR